MTAKIWAAVVLAACGGAPAPPAVSVQSAPAATTDATDAMPRQPQSAVLQWMKSTLAAGGHACHVTGETLVCDDKKENVPTVGVVWADESNLGPYVGLVASFNWKDPSGCANSMKRLNELNSKFDLLRSSCTDENLVFALTVPLGERSLTAADAKGLTTYFQSLVAAVLRSSDLLPLLK